MPNSTDGRDDWRYERKYIVQKFSTNYLENIIKLHPKLFSETFQERTINNIYFDTLNLAHFYDNVDGSSERRKYRIRWYGELLGLIKKPNLEIKIKSGALGKKLSFPLANFRVEAGLKPSDLSKLFEKSDLPDNEAANLKLMSPTLLNRYKRKYFVSYDQKFRITIDSELEYYQFYPGKNDLFNRQEDPRIILEIKYHRDQDDEAHLITQDLPLRLSRSSKYVTGMELINN